jgi:hypothetical protein
MSVSDYFISGNWPQFVINIIIFAFVPTFFSQIAFISATLAVCRYGKKTDVNLVLSCSNQETGSTFLSKISRWGRVPILVLFGCTKKTVRHSTTLTLT